MNFIKKMPVSAMISAVLLITLLIAVIFAPFIAPYGKNEVVGDVWQEMSVQHWLGTDNIGRDMLTRMLYGGYTTIFISTAATMLSFIVGAVLAFSVVVIRGWVEMVVSRLVDLLISIPSLIFALVILSVVPSTVTFLILVMAFLDFTRVFRVSRAIAEGVYAMDFVEAARLRGERLPWIVLREILPNTLSPLVAEFGLRFIFMVLFLSTLSFLGLGIQPPETDWGTIVRENREGLVYGVGASLIPALAILFLTISVNIIADWILSITSNLKGDR